MGAHSRSSRGRARHRGVTGGIHVNPTAHRVASTEAARHAKGRAALAPHGPRPRGSLQIPGAHTGTPTLVPGARIRAYLRRAKADRRVRRERQERGGRCEGDAGPALGSLSSSGLTTLAFDDGASNPVETAREASELPLSESEPLPWPSSSHASLDAAAAATGPQGNSRVASATHGGGASSTMRTSATPRGESGQAAAGRAGVPSAKAATRSSMVHKERMGELNRIHVQPPSAFRRRLRLFVSAEPQGVLPNNWPRISPRRPSRARWSRPPDTRRGT